MIAICIGLLPWLAGGVPQPSIVTAQPTDDVRLSSEQQLALSLLEQVLKENIQRVAEPLDKQRLIINSSAETLNNSFFGLQRVS
ncbi:methyl-accepting chemotaxis protein, partial [Vibrio cholerae]|nr:methyl-accepting chemotaxis protein [Vibrio cholerae]